MAPDSDDVFQVHMKDGVVSYSGVIFQNFEAQKGEVTLWWSSEEGDGTITLDVTQIAEIYIMVKDAEILTFVPIK